MTEHTHSYNDLTNLPKINNIQIDGNHNSTYYKLQDKLTTAQMNSVNSGMTAQKRIQFENLSNTKQQALNATQLNAVNSGLTAAELTRIQAKLIELENRIEALEGGT